MSNLDDAKPTGLHGLYKVEVNVEGSWVWMGLMDKAAIIQLTDQADVLSDESMGDES